MNEVLARQAEPAPLAGLPNRISDVVTRMAEERPTGLALTEPGRAWTFGDLARIVGDTAQALGRLGVRPGDRILIVSENSLALAALLFAASKLDAWAVVASPRLSGREVDQIGTHSGARRAFYVIGIGQQAAEHARRNGAVVEALPGLGQVAVGPLDAEAVPEPVHAAAEEQVAVLLYTSGTTGNPKGVMLTHRNLLFSAFVSGSLRSIGPADCIYGVLPMSHIVGLTIILVSSIMFGALVRVVPQYDPADLAAAIAEDTTIIYGVPATYQRLLEYKAVKGLPKLAAGKLRCMFVAGAPLDLTLKARVEEELGQPLLNGYGITECSPGVSSVQSAYREDDTVGTIIPGVETRVVDRSGRTVASGEVGELHVRGPNVMRGYYRAPEATAAAIDADGWFKTGDLARFAGEDMYIVGRSKELIIRSGFNVYPPEVEAVLSSHPDVVQSAVIGRAVEGNEEVVGYVQLLPGSKLSSADLLAFVRPLLTPYKRPAEIVILDVLPASSTGKILKHKLAEAARTT
ncbi:class I adenylate-forming enzyme family protein [Chelatococcus reniformis]|uniref:AMP-binding protein n=1 Tax=Chelatococcus reniformis TaxID=1494448 RepID=A0A916UTC5_9HYPH|nr:AMP-binding protein [Chelatococcus reniformis]GGC86650.1 AMP-binding protein [Chelatococcus reniformis]